MKNSFNIEDFITVEKIQETKKRQIVEKYTDIVAKVYDKKRDERLSEYLDNDSICTSTIIEIIDDYEKRKENVIKHMEKTIQVVIKSEKE